MLYQILSFGIWPALPVTGYAIIRQIQWDPKSVNLPKLSFFSLQCVTGITIWSFALLVSAYLGFFRGYLFGTIGWLISLYWCVKTLITRRKAGCHLFGHFSPWDWLLTIGLLGAFSLYFFFPSENIRGGRDMGVYANQAVYTANHGTVFIPYPENNQIRNIVKDHSWVLPGFTKTGHRMSMLFPDLYSLWLAQAYATFGSFGLFRLDSFFAVLSLSVFFGVLYVTLNHKAIAALATLFLAYNVSQIWITRQTLTEIFQQMVFWAGVLTFTISLLTTNKNMARISGVITGITTLIRIDSFFLLPLFFVGHTLVKIVSQKTKDQSSNIFMSFYQTALPIFFMVFLYYRFLKTGYYQHLLQPLTNIGYVALISLIILVTCTRIVSNNIEKILSNKTAAIGISAIIIAIGVYAYWIRPYTSPDTTFYYDKSAVNLAKYISPVGFWVGILGCVLILYELIMKKLHIHLSFILVVVGGFTTLYLWRSSITPDHYWAIRRFVPVIIPGFVFFGACFIRRLTVVIPIGFFMPVAAAIIICFSVFTYQAGSLVFTFQEQKSVFSGLKSFSKKLPAEQLILVDEVHNGELTTPLFVAFGRPVLRSKLSSDHGAGILKKWLHHQKTLAKPVYLLKNTGKIQKNINSRLINQQRLPYAATAQTVNPLPNKNHQYDHNLLLYEIDGIQYDFYNNNLIINDTFGIKRTGFWGIEKWGGRHLFRWTNGNAKIIIPLSGNKPERLLMDIGSAGFQNNEIKIIINSKKMFADKMPKSGFVKSFSLKSIELNDKMVIQILSNTFKPKIDKRHLGVAIKKIMIE